MCTAIRDMVNKGKLEGRTDGSREVKAEDREIIICNMLRRGFSDEDICGLVECGLEFIEEIRKKNHL